MKIPQLRKKPEVKNFDCYEAIQDLDLISRKKLFFNKEWAFVFPKS